jgi:hypothetical protein
MYLLGQKYRSYPSLRGCEPAESPISFISPKLYSFCWKTYLEHHDLQHQPGPLLSAALRGSDPLHAAVGIRTRAAGMARAVCASAVERFQAVGQRDADHGGW